MTVPAPPTLDDYDAIAAAVMETERGRWFLAEFARRNRAADTAQILEALASLEARVRPSAATSPARGDRRPERLALLLGRLKETAGRLRQALGSDETPKRRIATAQKQAAQFERTIEIALSAAAGATIPPSRPAPKPKPVAPVLTAATVTLAAENAPALEMSLAATPMEAPNGAHASQALPDPALGEAGPALPAFEPEEPAPFAIAPRPVRRTTLLEGLSDAEKGLLFS